jgi:hypothetical protein
MRSKQPLMTMVSKKLRSNSFKLYARVMNELFQHHSNFEFVQHLSGLFRSGRYDLALSYADSLSEQKYSDATVHFVANQFASLIKKYPWNPRVVKTDPETMAIRTFLRFERRCFLLNRKFALYDKLRSPNEMLLSRMRSYIRYVIGDEPPMEQIFDLGAFGAGASLGVHGNATNLSRKILANSWSVTPSASVYAYWAIMRNPHLKDLFLESKAHISCLDWSVARDRFRSKLYYTDYNKLTFVPKTAKTHRVIAVEPLLNGYLQKGVDDFMRNCLKRVNINLQDQSRNQRMARLGSLNDSEDSLATIDLSSASDSISIGLVKNLLPEQWFYFLDSLRSKNYELEGKRNVYNKFCSMGNGFCFPLETLIFAACCHAVGCGKSGTDYSVYGDDIICRTKDAGNVLSSLRAIGFIPNASKTFLQGPFRESCGADYFGGIDVRPYTLDYALDSLESLFKWLNLTRRNDKTYCFFEGTWDLVLSQIPHRFQFFRPFKGNADSGIDAWGDQHLTSRNCFYNRRDGIWIVKELSHRSVHDLDFSLDAYRRDTVDVYALLSGVQSERYRVGYTFRRKTKTAIRFTACSGATSMWLPSSRA